MMKYQPLLIAALLAAPLHAFAADAVKFDLYVASDFKQAISLVGPNATVKVPAYGTPNATLEFRLIAPEPVILEIKETTSAGEVVGRIKLPTPGSSFTVADIKDAKFRSPYVLVRHD